MKYRASRSKINTTRGFKISIQTEDKETPSSVTIKLICWITPTIEDDYYKAIAKASKRLKSVLYKTINRNEFNQDRTIAFIDTADKLMKVNKASYASVNVILFQHKPYHKLKSETMVNELTEISNTIMNELVEMNQFKYSKTKS